MAPGRHLRRRGPPCLKSGVWQNGTLGSREPFPAAKGLPLAEAPPSASLAALLKPLAGRENRCPAGAAHSGTGHGRAPCLAAGGGAGFRALDQWNGYALASWSSSGWSAVQLGGSIRPRAPFQRGSAQSGDENQPLDPIALRCVAGPARPIPPILNRRPASQAGAQRVLPQGAGGAVWRRSGPRRGRSRAEGFLTLKGGVLGRKPLGSAPPMEGGRGRRRAG